MTAIIVGNHAIERDHAMDSIVADWFRAPENQRKYGRLNPERLVIQCGFVDDIYRVHIRFIDLTRMSADKTSQKIYFHVNHDNVNGRWAGKQGRLQWVLAALPMTLPMAYKAWTQQYGLKWPKGFPIPRTSQ